MSLNTKYQPENDYICLCTKWLNSKPWKRLISLLNAILIESSGLAIEMPSCVFNQKDLVFMADFSYGTAFNRLPSGIPYSFVYPATFPLNIAYHHIGPIYLSSVSYADCSLRVCLWGFIVKPIRAEAADTVSFQKAEQHSKRESSVIYRGYVGGITFF